jgi:transcriptional regulator with XRE-family HTH domain
MGRRVRITHCGDPAEVGGRLQRAREAAGLSQRELAFPGCSAAYISRIEQGLRAPSLQVLRELGRRVGTSEDWLAFGRERVDPAVARRLREVERVERAGGARELARAYAALGATATAVARRLEDGAT